MARKRMIDPDFWTDESLGQCTPMERLLFMGLISQSDDEGRLRGNPALIRSQIFPYDEVTTEQTDDMLAHLANAGLIERYFVEGQFYIWLPGFGKHQTINKPTSSKLPGPESADISQEVTTTVALPEECNGKSVALPPNRREEKRREYISPSGLEEEKPPRKRNPIWDVVCEVCGIDSDDALTETGESNVGKTVAELARIKATPEEIRRRADIYRRKYPTMPLTVPALRKHWGEIGSEDVIANRPTRTEDVYQILN